MAWIDLVIIGIIVLSALISLIRGFVKESISLVTWVVAGLLALRYYGPMADLLEPFINSVTLRQWVGGGILFVATLVVGAIVNFIVSQLVSKTGLSGTDKTLGVSFRWGARCAYRYHGCVACEPHTDAGSILVAGLCNDRVFSATGRMGQGRHSRGCGW